jgi:hypothetical protein
MCDGGDWVLSRWFINALGLVWHALKHTSTVGAAVAANTQPPGQEETVPKLLEAQQ